MKQIKEEYSLLKAVGNFYDTLPQSLVSTSQVDLLKKAANFFPPLIRFGLECRLNEQEQVDLQFCIRRDHDNLEEISDWFSQKFSGDEEHTKITSFLKKWADKNSIYHHSIAEVFLELDVLPSGIKAPLLFFELHPTLTDEQRKEFSRYILTETLGEEKAFFSRFEKIVNACPSPAFVAYLGILFSRDVDVLRVNIKKLPSTEVATFLQQIGYAWTGPELDQWISFVYDYADRVTLCIDIGKEIFPKIGFECFWKDKPTKETYWRAFVEKLNIHNKYNQNKIEEILNWDEVIYPEHIDEWPSHLWIDSLFKPQHEFTFLKKWISHLKLAYAPQQAIELKAYLGYESLWQIKINTPPVVTQNKQLDADSKPLLAEAIQKGIDYILSSQQQSGWWKDFYLTPGYSDEWVTAYVGYHLACLPSSKTKTSIERAWKALQNRYRKDEGWGYNMLTPADADSTIWVWIFAQQAGFASEFPETNLAIVNQYINTQGGVATYAKHAPIGRSMQEGEPPSFNGWKIVHNCVTAAYAYAGRQHAINYLLNEQSPLGTWYSYWWDGPEYATALTVEALSNKDASGYKDRIDLSVKWACVAAQKQLANQEPNDFKIALLLRIILCAAEKESYSDVINILRNHLLRSQESEGSWPASAESRSPTIENMAHETGENLWVIKDEKKNFSTITILDALNKYARFIDSLPLARI